MTPLLENIQGNVYHGEGKEPKKYSMPLSTWK